MSQKITTPVKDLVHAAKARLNELTAEEAIALQDNEDVVIVDIRDVRERHRDGYIKGSLHVPRGMLEFWICPDSPYHKSELAQDKHYVFHCASGWRSALAADVAQTMGMKPVSHIESGFNGWIKAGGPIVKDD